MKKILIITFLLSSLSLSASENVSFICINQALKSNQSQEYLSLFQTKADCHYAVYHSKNGFICNGNTLYSGSIFKIIAHFQSSGECLEAVANSK